MLRFVYVGVMLRYVYVRVTLRFANVYFDILIHIHIDMICGYIQLPIYGFTIIYDINNKY